MYTYVPDIGKFSVRAHPVIARRIDGCLGLSQKHQIHQEGGLKKQRRLPCKIDQ